MNIADVNTFDLITATLGLLVLGFMLGFWVAVIALRHARETEPEIKHYAAQQGARLVEDVQSHEKFVAGLRTDPSIVTDGPDDHA